MKSENKQSNELFLVKGNHLGYLPYTASWEKEFTKRTFMEETQMGWEEAIEQGFEVVKVRFIEV